MLTKEQIVRFWAKVAIANENECWNWTASLSSSGYGRFNVNGENRIAARVSWEIHYGEIKNKLHVLHKCDNPSCVNPKHLYLGTHQDNMRDRQIKGRTHRHLGITNGSAKLTENDIREIRRRSANGESQRQLARAFGVTRMAIKFVIKGHTWSWLD